MPSATPNPPETYGIHALKAFAILMQIFAHTYLWLVLAHMVYLRNLITIADYIGLAMGALSMAVPMTGGAVLRLVSQLNTTNNRVINIKWPTMIWSMALLALFESLKHVLAIGSSFFFMWDVLHLIAVSFLLTLFIAQYSIKALWSAALTIIFITPFVTDLLAPLENTAIASHGLQPKTIYIVLAAALLLATLNNLRKSPSFTGPHKQRIGIMLTALTAMVIGYISTFQTNPIEQSLFSTLWLGALVGVQNGLHIWPLFPWAGVVMLGFLIYHTIVINKTSARTLIVIGSIGMALMFFFFRFYAPAFFTTFADHSFVTSAFFNRTPALPILIVGAFCLMAPLAALASRAKLETPYVVLLSRSILWVYIYQTSVLVIASNHISNRIVYAIFALVSSLLLPFAVKWAPLNIRLSLKKEN